MAPFDINLFVIILVISLLVIMYIIARLFRAIKMVNARVTMLSHLVKQMRRDLKYVETKEELGPITPEEPTYKANNLQTESKEAKKPVVRKGDVEKLGQYAEASDYGVESIKIDLADFEEISKLLDDELKS